MKGIKKGIKWKGIEKGIKWKGIKKGIKWKGIKKGMLHGSGTRGTRRALNGRACQ